MDAPKEDTPESWRVECERAVFNASVLFRLAKAPGGPAAPIAEMIRTAPRSQKDLDEIDVTSLFSRITLDAHRLSPNDVLFRSAIEYFVKHLIAMTPARRSMLEASVTGALMGYVMG
jgi:hypothetical protein